jgi:hypothetical protein
LRLRPAGLHARLACAPQQNGPGYRGTIHTNKIPRELCQIRRKSKPIWRLIMNRLLILLWMAPAVAFSASSIDGTWKTKADTFQQSGKPDSYELSNGTYHCNSCVPAVNVKADGTDQSVTGHDYYDTYAVRVISSNSIETTVKKGGKVIGTDTISVSADGKTLTEKFVDYSGAQAATGTSTSSRLTAAAPGAHAVSGTWQPAAFSNPSDTLITVKYESTPDGLKMQWNGQSYDAKFDGKEYPTRNDPGNTMVSLKRIDANTIEETDRRAGKVTDVIRSTVSADGNSLSVVDTMPVRGTTMSYTMVKQR